MPDVGVLNLQIHDNSSTAAEGLGRLAAKLEAVKAATGGVRLGSVATGIKRINDELKNVQPSAINKLKQLADVLERIGTISGNVGGIRISFGGNRQSVEQIAAQMQDARTSAAQTTAEFEQIGNRIQEDIEKSNNFSNSIGKVNEIVQQTGWSAQTTAEQFSDLFNAWNAFRMSNSLNAGSNPLAIGDGSGGSGAEWAYWKDGAVEVEGTVSDAMETIRLEAGQTIPLLTGIVEENEKVGQSFKSYTFVEDATEKVEALRRIFADSSDAVKQIIANIFGIDKNILFQETAASNVQTFEKELQTASGSAKELSDSLKRDYGKQMVEDLVNASSKTDLLKMRIDSLKDSLAQKINNNTVDGNQIAQATSQIQALQQEYDELVRKSSEAENETKSLASKFSELIFGAEGLDGAFKRMLPTISGLLSRFKSLVKYRILRAIIKQISEGFREGTENYYKYSEAIGGSFAPAMDSAVSSLAQMKNSIGAAAAPVIQALIPYLQMAVNWFITAINYANQFFALLGGQTSWSRAVPQTAKAFDKVKKSAGGAGAAIKDLLADWDELNIIQSESGGGGGGGGGAAMEDYMNMFEESYEFNDKIKSAVEWIKDHMDSILAIAKSIGVAILAWKVSRAFGGLIGDLASLVLGGALIDIGLRVAYEGAYEAGYNGGFDAASFIATVGGSITAAIGGAIIGYKFFGTWGSVIGGALGLIASIGVAVYAYDKGNKQRIEESKWGSIHYTAEQIEEYARSQFTFDIDAEIEVAKAYIKNRLAAKLKLTVALAKFKASLSKASAFGVDAEINVDTTEGQARINALKDAADDAINTIDALRTLIDENEKGLEFTMTNFKFVDNEGTDISGDLLNALNVADTTLKDYFTDIGTQISKWIYEGEKSGWANGEYQMALELMQSQQRVMDKAEELSKQKLYDMTTTSSIAGAKNAFAVQDYDTAKGIIEAEQTRYEEFYNEAVASVESQKEDLIYLASLAEAAATELESTLAKETDPSKRADIEAKISELNESAKTFTTLAEEITADFDAKVEERIGESKKKQIEAWTAMLQEVYGADYASRLFGKTNEGGSAFEFLDDLFGLGHSTDDWIKRVIEESGVEGAAQELYNYLYASISDVDTTGGTKFFVETLGGNLYELIKNNVDLVRDIADGLIANTDNRQIAYDIFKSMFNLDDDTASKYIQTYTQNVWEDAINASFPDEKEMPQIDVTQPVEVMLEEEYKVTGDRKASLENLMNNLFPESNVDLLNRPVLDYGDYFETLFTSTITAGVDKEAEIPWNADIVMNLTPIMPDGTKLTDSELREYVQDLLGESSSINELFLNDSIENGGKGLLINILDEFDSLDEGITKAVDLAQKLHELQELYYGGSGGSGGGGAPSNYANIGASVMQGINATFANMKNILPWMSGSSDVTVKETRDSGEEIGNTAEGTRQGTSEIVTGQNTMNGYMQQVAMSTAGMVDSQGTANSYMAQMVSLLRTIASQGGGAAPAAQSVMGGMVAGALAAFEAVRG